MYEYISIGLIILACLVYFNTPLVLSYLPDSMKNIVRDNVIIVVCVLLGLSLFLYQGQSSLKRSQSFNPSRIFQPVPSYESSV